MKNNIGYTIDGPKPLDNFSRSIKKDTLFIPGIFGQWEPWRKKISEVSKTVDLTIQLGNIIGLHEEVVDNIFESRGYNSMIVENIFENYINESWVQLVGTNEIIAITQVEKNIVDEYSAQLLRENFFSDNSNMFFAFAHNDRLITHGGLTHGLWVELGKPKTASRAADLINEKYAKQLFFSNSLRIGNPPNLCADPIFCDDIHELYPSWIYAEERCPFEQVFAQTINSIRGRHAKSSEYCSLYWLDDSCFHYPRFGSIVNIRDTQFFGLDLGLNTEKKSDINLSRKMWIERSFS